MFKHAIHSSDEQILEVHVHYLFLFGVYLRACIVRWEYQVYLSAH